jgi:hypothetical protein
VQVSLPNPEQAVIDDAKLRDYLLSPTHPVGRFKAPFFAALGYTQENWHQLGQDLREQHVGRQAQTGDLTKYGQKYRIVAEFRGPSGRIANVVSVWIVLLGEDFPRFVTAHPGVR